MKEEISVGLALVYKGKEVNYEGYKRQFLHSNFFKRSYKGFHSSNVEISFPEVKSTNSKNPIIEVDEVKIVKVDYSGNEVSLWSSKLDKNIRLSACMTPLFRKGKLKIERVW